MRTALHHRKPSVALRRYSALRMGASKGGKAAESALKMLHLRSRGRVLRQRLAHVKNTKGDHAVAEEAATIIQEWYQKKKERRLDEKLNRSLEREGTWRRPSRVGKAAVAVTSMTRTKSAAP